MKKTIRENRRVVIDVADDYEAEEVKRQVLRHLDVNKRDVHIDWDIRHECSFCKYDPEEDKDGPVCCQPAIDEWTANQATKITQQEGA